jgi:ATP-dependent RNA helicase DDX18/HAS1
VTGEGVAIKKVTNVFSKKILAKRALREIKLLQHFRGMSFPYFTLPPIVEFILTDSRTPKCTFNPAHDPSTLQTTSQNANMPGSQITCLYDMDIPRPDNFNECYLYEGTGGVDMLGGLQLTLGRTHGV